MSRTVVPGLFDGPPVMPGTVVGSTFRIGALRQRTRHGALYDAHDMAVERPVALLLGWRDQPADLLADARRIARLRGGFAAAIYSTGIHAGLPFVIGEAITGLSTSAWRMTQPSPIEILTVSRTLAAGVSAAHLARVPIGPLQGDHLRIVTPQRVIPSSLSLGQIGVGNEQPRQDLADVAAWSAVDALELGHALAQLTMVGAREEAASLASRTDLPSELYDIIEELRQPSAGRRPSVADVAAQLDALATQQVANARRIGVVICDNQVARAHEVAGLVRRSHPFVSMTLTTSGNDALLQARRPSTHAVLVDVGLAGDQDADAVIAALAELANIRAEPLRIGVLLERPHSETQQHYWDLGATDIVVRDQDVAPSLQLFLAQAERRIVPRGRSRRVSG